MTFADEVKNAVTTRAALLVVGVLALQLLFIASYVGALHRPDPTDVPFGVVAPQQVSGQLVTQLDSLPGVGPVTAQKILDWRQQHGRFSRADELQEVDGIGPKTYARLAPHVRV